MENENKALVPAQKGNEVVTFNPKQDVVRAQEAATALMGLLQKQKNKVVFNGVQFLQFADWQTIGQFFQHSVGIEWTKPIMYGDKCAGYEAKAVIYNRDGVIVGGAESACMRDERNWATKPEFQLRSMAQTRAMAKALRSRFGFIATLAGCADTPAEEMDAVTTTIPHHTTTTATVPYTVQYHVTANESAPIQQPAYAPRPASDAQKRFIKGLMQSKGIVALDEAFPDVARELDNLTSPQASDLIKRLQEFSNPTLDERANDVAQQLGGHVEDNSKQIDIQNIPF